jgi:flagellar motor component MotA
VKIIGLWISVLGIFLLANALEGGQLSGFIQPTAFLAVFGPCLAFTVYLNGFVGSFRFLGRIVSEKATESDLDTVSRVASVGLLSGGVGSVLGFIHVFSNLSDSTKLGAGVALAFVAYLYGLVPMLFLTAVSSNRGSKKLSVAHDTRSRRAAGFVTIGLTSLLMVFFTVLYALSKT